LGEIERVCDFLVAIDAGRLLRAAALGTFMQHTGTLVVEVDDDPMGLARRLAEGGSGVRVDGRHVLVEMRGDATYDVVRDAVVDLGLALVRLEQRRSSLEDLFRDEDDSREAAA
jgi:ABC-2 type transport system ATP-binding protein